MPGACCSFKRALQIVSGRKLEASLTTLKGLAGRNGRSVMLPVAFLEGKAKVRSWSVRLVFPVLASQSSRLW